MNKGVFYKKLFVGNCYRQKQIISCLAAPQLSILSWFNSPISERLNQKTKFLYQPYLLNIQIFNILSFKYYHIWTVIYNMNIWDSNIYKNGYFFLIFLNRVFIMTIGILLIIIINHDNNQ